MITGTITKTFSHYSENIVYSIQSTFKQNRAMVITAIASLALCAFVVTLSLIKYWRNKTYNKGLDLYGQTKYKEAFPFLLTSAQRGFVKAQYNVAKCFDEGNGTKEDQEKAFFWYKEAAKQGDATAQFDVGCCYEDGAGVAKNLKEAVFWYKKAADAGNAGAKINLAEYYLEEGDDQNPNKALQLLNELAEKRDSKAQNLLGEIFQKGKGGVEKNIKEAVRWYKKAIENDNNRDAKFNLGCYFFKKVRGKGKNQITLKKAMQSLTEAAEAGHAYAQNKLGNIFSSGKLVEKDINKAIEWYNKAIKQELTLAKYNLATLYFKDAEYKNLGKAIQLFEEAADDEDEDAQDMMGDFYAKGLPGHIEKNMVEAVKWYEKAAIQGNLASQTSLGLCYLEGDGVEQNYTVAMSNFRNAAEQDHDEALFQMGQCYEKGFGVEKNADIARSYYKRANDQGNVKAQEALDRLNNNPR